jgi:hypothetical protein
MSCLIRSRILLLAGLSLVVPACAGALLIALRDPLAQLAASIDAESRDAQACPEIVRMHHAVLADMAGAIWTDATVHPAQLPARLVPAGQAASAAGEHAATHEITSPVIGSLHGVVRG